MPPPKPGFPGVVVVVMGAAAVVVVGCAVDVAAMAARLQKARGGALTVSGVVVLHAGSVFQVPSSPHTTLQGGEVLGVGRIVIRSAPISFLTFCHNPFFLLPFQTFRSPGYLRCDFAMTAQTPNISHPSITPA